MGKGWKLRLFNCMAAFLILAVTAVIAGCGGIPYQSTGEVSPQPTASPIILSALLSGQVTDSVTNAAIEGVTVGIGTISTTTSTMLTYLPFLFS